MLQPVHKSTRKPETSVTPNAPTLNTHTHTAQPQPDQNRADHGHATNPTDPTGLSASPGSSELTQVVCCNLQCLFTLSSVPPKCHLWEMLLLFFFGVAEGFRSAELHLVSQGAILAMFYYLRVFARMRLCLCVCTYALPVVQTWVLDVTDGPASMQSVCVGQDVPLEQMHSGLLQHCV